MTPPHSASTCRVLAARRPFKARLDVLLSAASLVQLPSTPASTTPCTIHRVSSGINAATQHARSVFKSHLRRFSRLPCCLPAATALARTSHRSTLDPRPPTGSNRRAPSLSALAFLCDYVMCEEKRALMRNHDCTRINSAWRIALANA